MAIKTVTWTSSTFIECAGIVLCGSVSTVPIFLSVLDGLAAPSPSGAARNTIPAALTKVVVVPLASTTGCGAATYTYTFSYDDALLVGAGTLVSANILGVKCAGIGTDLIDDKIHEEILTVSGRVWLCNLLAADIHAVGVTTLDASRDAILPNPYKAAGTETSYLLVNPSNVRSLSYLIDANFVVLANISAPGTGAWSFITEWRQDGGPWKPFTVATYAWGPFGAPIKMPWLSHFVRHEVLPPGGQTLIEIQARVNTDSAATTAFLETFEFQALIDGHLI